MLLLCKIYQISDANTDRGAVANVTAIQDLPDQSLFLSPNDHMCCLIRSGNMHQGYKRVADSEDTGLAMFSCCCDSCISCCILQSIKALSLDPSM